MAFKDIGTAFLTGFLTQKGKQMTTANERAQDYYDLQLRLAEGNKGKHKSRVAVANNLVSVANEIRGLYGSEEQIKAAFAQGPSQMQNLLTRMRADKVNKGAGWTKDYVQNTYAKIPDNVLNSPDWLKYSEMDTTDYIMETLGVKKYEVGDYKSPDSTFWDRLSGKNRMARTRADLDELEFYEGMSVYDINQSANEADYNSLLPGAFLEYTTEKFITSSVITDFRDAAAKVLKDANQNATYKNLSTMETDIFNNLPEALAFRTLVKDRTKDSSGKTIVDLTNLLMGEIITFAEHAVDRVTEEEFNAWVKNDDTVDTYIEKVTELAKIRAKKQEMLKLDMDGLIAVGEKDYGVNFTKDTNISRIINKYLPNYAVGETATVDATVDAKVDGAVDGAEEFERPVLLDPRSNKAWKWTNPKGKTYRLLNPNSDNPTILPILPNGILDFKNKETGRTAKALIDALGLSFEFEVDKLTLTDKERMLEENRRLQGYKPGQDSSSGPLAGVESLFVEKPTREELVPEKGLIIKVVNSNKAEDFFLAYQWENVKNLSDDELIDAFKDMYNGEIPKQIVSKEALANAIKNSVRDKPSVTVPDDVLGEVE